MSKKFNTVKKWYTSGVFAKEAAKEMVKDAVKKGYITTAEYEEITGEAYEQ